jgi:hypothetical protein
MLVSGPTVFISEPLLTILTNYFTEVREEEKVDTNMAGMSENGFGGVAARRELQVQFQRFCCR